MSQRFLLLPHYHQLVIMTFSLLYHLVVTWEAEEKGENKYR